MIERLAEHIVEGQIRQGNLGESDRSLYRYSYIIFISQIVNLLAAFVIAVCFKDFRSVLLFLVLFIPLRTYAGGIHAKSPELCALVSGLILCFVCIANRLGALMDIGRTVLVAVEAVSAAAVWVLAPVEDSNKPLDEIERPRYRIRARRILCAEVLLFGVSFGLKAGWLSFGIALCHLLMMVSVIAGSIKRKMKKRQ